MKAEEDLKIPQTQQNNYDLPTELCVKPLALLGISGLDTINNAVHKLIWEAFSTNRREERAAVYFRLIENHHEFPLIKPKRNSYDWYIPKGILKRNWMNKYLYEIPAVIVIFYELDWNDPLWNEKMIECASRVQSMRAALEGRNTRITVVLIQNSLPMPAGEDVLASDRAVALCASCELNATSLFVLPHGDHLQGYVVRLENAFYELALNFYHGEIKTIRSHKDHLNKTTHQSLIVRHQFKMGFLYEMKQDNQTAHKHYTHAYNNLLEIRIVDTNALEIRTIAGFINYKLCRLMFALTLPRDAISQFKAHIDRFRSRMGFKELSFEHFAWLSKQFAVFGDIFDEAVKLGLPAVQTQHPGIYYQQAAQFAITRKQVCQELCSNIIAYPQSDPLEGASYVEFYGQRPWRPGKISAEPPDPQIESNGIQALQYLEKQVNHSNIIIALYGLAITQYKTYRCPRTRRHLVLQMADEYYNSRDYGKALTLLTHMLWDFRTEAWGLIMSNILEKALHCAYLTASVQDYILLALEILGMFCILNVEYKKKVHENLRRILKKQIPFGDIKLPKDSIQNAVIQWQPIFKADSDILSIDISNINSCIEIRARFAQIEYEIDQKIRVEIYVKNNCSFPLSFSKISVSINSLEHSVSENLQNFKHDEIKKFVIEFLADSNDLEKQIQIGVINLIMGDSNDFQINLKYDSSVYQTIISKRINRELVHFRYNPNKIDFENIQFCLNTKIIPRHSKLSLNLNHASPALLGEWYEIEMIIKNEEEFDIDNMKVEINLSDNEHVDAEFSKDSGGIPEKLPLILLQSKFLKRNENCFVKLHMRAHRIGDKKFETKISYSLNQDKPVISIKNEKIVIPSVKPFDITTRFLSSLMEIVNKFYVGEEICVRPILYCSSPWPIIIESTAFEFLPPFKAVENSNVKGISNMKLKKEEVAVEMFLGACEKDSDQNVSVGRYTIKWKRESGRINISQLTIIGLSCEWIPLELNLSVPAYGVVRTPLLVCYHLYNRSHQLIQLDVNLEASDAFMYAGYKQFSVSILPESVRNIQYNLYPLIEGSVALPKLGLVIHENSPEGPALRQDQLNFLIQRSLPTHIYVMPQVKGNPKTTNVIEPRKVTSI